MLSSLYIDIRSLILTKKDCSRTEINGWNNGTDIFRDLQGTPSQGLYNKLSWPEDHRYIF